MYGNLIKWCCSLKLYSSSPHCEMLHLPDMVFDITGIQYNAFVGSNKNNVTVAFVSCNA